MREAQKPFMAMIQNAFMMYMAGSQISIWYNLSHLWLETDLFWLSVGIIKVDDDDIDGNI